jgi:hypothetical protein
VKGAHLKITQPHTPQLMTRQRSRPTLMKSHTELEDEEVERMQKYVLGAKIHPLFLSSNWFLYSSPGATPLRGRKRRLDVQEGQSGDCCTLVWRSERTGLSLG